MRNKRADHERGAALITVLFIFVLVAGIAMTMLSRQQLEIRRTTTLLSRAQAYQQALGAEEQARHILTADATTTPDIDYPGQRWAARREPTPIPGGTVTFFIEDAQGKFNLNSLIGGDDTPKATFTELLKAQGVREELVAATVAQLGKKTAPRPFTSIQDWRAAEGVSPEDFNAIAPLVDVLPTRDADLNLNTASPAVLRAYLPNDTSRERIETVLRTRGFISGPQLRAIGFSTQGLGVKSDFFNVISTAQVNGRTLTLTSRIERTRDVLGTVRCRVTTRDLTNE